MPELTKDCPITKCGRKFKHQADLDKHIERRHPDYKWEKYQRSPRLYIEA
jgi:hypothetical protein